VQGKLAETAHGVGEIISSTGTCKCILARLAAGSLHGAADTRHPILFVTYA